MALRIGLFCEVRGHTNPEQYDGDLGLLLVERCRELVRNGVSEAPIEFLAHSSPTAQCSARSQNSSYPSQS